LNEAKKKQDIQRPLSLIPFWSECFNSYMIRHGYNTNMEIRGKFKNLRYDMVKILQ
jgi:hypothetical protein